MAQVTEAWRCNECYEVHESEDDAYDCCPRKVADGWKCTKCGDFHHEKLSAEECCEDEFICPACETSFETLEQAEACCGKTVPLCTPQELEKAGQQRLPI
jgi:hypothetical protein